MAEIDIRPRNDENDDFNRAKSYVTEIKHRFEHNPEIYFSFLDLLHSYQQNRWSLSRVLEEAVKLFVDHLDLLRGLLLFFPDATYRHGCEKMLCLVTEKYESYIKNACEEKITHGRQNFSILKLPKNLSGDGRHMLAYYWRTASCLVADTYEFPSRKTYDALSHANNSSCHDREIWTSKDSKSKKSPVSMTKLNIIQMMINMNNCPSLLLRLAIRVHPEIMMRPLDEDTCSSSFILHMAASSKKGVMCSDAAEEIFSDMERAYPNAIDMVDATGRVPLLLAIFSGKEFDRGVNILLHANPQLLNKIDPLTGLYPFMLAASSSSIGTDETSLDNAYRLLRQGPELIQNCNNSK